MHKNKKNWILHRVLNSKISRRDALKTFGLGASTLLLPQCASVPNLFNSASDDLTTADGRYFGPIDRSRNNDNPKIYSGDNPDRTHQIIWNKKEYLAAKGGVPRPTEHVPVVIIGGGMSGIISGYLLRKYKPVMLERADHFGGNSRGESWQGIDYSIGAAYFMEQKSGSPLAKFYQETSIDQMWTSKNVEDPVIFNKQSYENIWSGKTAPESARQFHKVHTYFEQMFKGEQGLIFPEMPSADSSMQNYLKQLDQQTFLEHVRKVAGGKLHPHIETALEHFCWSTMGSSISEISAAAGLNQYVGEFGSIYVTPGGNSAVAERILQLTRKENPASNFRPSSVVMHVERVSDGVIVSYEDHTGTLRSIHAKAVVMACPKFVAKHILNNIEPHRHSAISKLRYTPYLVANVLIEGKVKDRFYDLFLLGDGKVNFNDVATSANEQKVTDVVLGTYASADKERTVLTLYRSLPYTTGRGLIFAPTSFETYYQEFEKQLHEEILPLVGISKNQIKGLRLSRWGHPMPVPVKGLIADGTVDEIRRPFAERVFFVEQDNWLLPCLETSASEALTWTAEIKKLLV